MTEKTKYPLADNAISKFDEDVFDFSKQAERIAKLVASKDSPDTISISLSGSWGSGKSSMLNLIKTCLTDEKCYCNLFKKDYSKGTLHTQIVKDMPLVIEFDPWFFGNEDEIIKSFFIRIAKAIISDQNIQEDLKTKIGKGFFWLSRITKLACNTIDLITLGKLKTVSEPIREITDNMSDFSDILLDEKSKDFFDIKEELSNDLSKIDKKKIIILIDDMDRLQVGEILSMLKVIRLVTDLPKINTVIAFDQVVTSEIIGSHVGGNGHSFLQKMINIPTHIPRISEPKVREFLKNNLSNHPDTVKYQSKKSNFYKSDNWDFSGTTITTVRAAKLLVNQFFYGMSAISEDVDSIDYWGLCVLIHYYPKIANAMYLQKYPFIQKSFNKKQYIMIDKLDKNKIEKICKEFNITENDPVLEIYLRQFEELNTKTDLAIQNMKNIDAYFSFIANPNFDTSDYLDIYDPHSFSSFSKRHNLNISAHDLYL